MTRSPFSLVRQAVEQRSRDSERMALLPDRSSRIQRAEVEPTPYELVYVENKLRLRYYESDCDRQQDVPVVLAYALINTPAILDIDHDRSVVGQFLEHGFDVYLIDWGEPSALDRSLSLSDYVVRYLDNCVDAVREQSRSDEVHLLGVSVSSPICAAYAALFPEKVATLGLQGPPLNFDAEGGMLDFRELARTLNPQRLVETFGNIPAPLIDLSFSLREPIEYTVRNPLRLWERLDDEEYVERAGRLARWTIDGPDIAGDTYRQIVEELLFENKLIENRLVLNGRQVDLENVTVPVALILGANDKFVPHEASLPFIDAIPSGDTEVFEFPTDHVGTFVDDTAHADWWPRVCNWFSERS